jgi:hypothetical protein
MRGVFLAKLGSSLYWFAVILLALGGAVQTIVREKWRGLLHPAILAWSYFAFVHAVTLAQDRYHFPSIPYIAMLAGVATVSLLRRFGRPHVLLHA